MAGNVNALELVEIRNGAIVKGELSMSRTIIEDGAPIDGSMNIP